MCDKCAFTDQLIFIFIYAVPIPGVFYLAYTPPPRLVKVCDIEVNLKNPYYIVHVGINVNNQIFTILMTVTLQIKSICCYFGILYEAFKEARAGCGLKNRLREFLKFLHM